MLINHIKNRDLYFFLPNLKYGGAEKVLISFANRESSQRNNVSLIVGNSYGELINDIDPKVKIINLNRKKVISCLPYLLRLGFYGNNVHLFTTMYHCNVICCFVKILFPRMMLTIRESTSIDFYRSHLSSLKYRGFKFLSSLFYPFADELIFPSKDMEKTFIEFTSGKSANHIVVANPVDEKLINKLSQESIPDSLWKPKSRNIIVNVGRVDKNKNQILILEALNLIKDQDFEFIQVGDGPELNNLKDYVSKNNLADKVTFLGYQKNPFKFMKASSIFVLSSLYEGYPNVLAQAKVMNLKIISTDCPTGPREILEGYDKGELINSSHDLKSSLIKHLK